MRYGYMWQTREATQELIRVRHEEFAHRAEGRLEEAADRLEGDARALGIHGGASKTAARAGELRVAALLVRGEAEAVSAAETPCR